VGRERDPAEHGGIGDAPLVHVRPLRRRPLRGRRQAVSDCGHDEPDQPGVLVGVEFEAVTSVN
jgi:hypothetical protein